MISHEKTYPKQGKPKLFNVKLPGDWFVTILNCLHHPILLTNDKEQIIYMNKAAQLTIEEDCDLTTALRSRFHWKCQLGNYTLIECDSQGLAQRIIGENAEELFHRIFEGLHIVDKKGTTIFYNKTCEELDGLSADNVLNRSIFELYPKLNEYNSTFFKALKTGQEYLSHESKYSSIKKKNIEVLSSTIPLFIDEQLTGAAEIIHDIKSGQNLSGNLSEIRERTKKSKGSLRAHYHFEDIVGESTALKKTIELARQAAETDLPVFITGETGTGKELFAQSIHHASPFSQGPFVAVNCAAIPDNLLESLLFGTVKGAFTGAENRAGLLEHAAAGSVFFDEVQSLSTSMQAKLLRIIQEKTFQRVGCIKQIPFRARIISASNLAPAIAIANKVLREDLYYRLCVFVVNIPPLRERKEDLPVLTEHFLKDFNEKTGKQYQCVDETTAALFQDYHWPGNVRELEHLLLTQSIISQPDSEGFLRIEADSLSGAAEGLTFPKEQPPPSSKKTLADILMDTERETIMEALREHDSNITRASSALGISRQSLQYRMSKLEITVEREATVAAKELPE